MCCHYAAEIAEANRLARLERQQATESANEMKHLTIGASDSS
jgi:hypothetical protein